MGTRTLVLLGHPDADSFCGTLAQAYVKGARSAGNDVRLLALGELQFEPVLRHGYRTVQPLEPDLVTAQESIAWAEHIVFVYPIWWGAMPALLKGFIDRVFLPGFAFKYRKGSMLWDRLLSGRSAHLITTMDTPPWYYRWIYGAPGHKQMKKTILEFSGILPVRISSFGPIRDSTAERRARWLERAYQQGKRLRK